MLYVYFKLTSIHRVKIKKTLTRWYGNPRRMESLESLALKGVYDSNPWIQCSWSVSQDIDKEIRLKSARTSQLEMKVA